MTTIRVAAVFALLCAAAFASMASADQRCEQPSDFEARGWIEAEGIVIFYRTRPETIEVGQPFALEVIVCAMNPARRPSGLSVEAVMPNRREPMNVRAQVLPKGDDRYRVEGMLFHLPGKWRFFFDVRVGGGSERLWQDIELE